jgi:hypothetical protein
MGSCAFCGPVRGDLSGEDIWPRWFSKYQRRSADPRMLFHQAYFDGRWA